VEGFDSKGGGVTAVVGGREELGAAESSLDVRGGRREYGGVGDGHVDCFCLLLFVEL